MVVGDGAQISIHAPANGATFPGRKLRQLHRISIHAPANGATLLISQCSLLDLFQSTLRRTERRKAKPYCSSSKRFQSTLRRTERRYHFRFCKFIKYFNPRSGERSDPEWKAIHQQNLISIHAPANGATAVRFKRYIDNKISIHAPANGATIFPGRKLRQLHRISIHAPANGATTHTAVMSADPIFQSTLRRTERRFGKFSYNFLCNFNPRSGERSDRIRYVP